MHRLIIVLVSALVLWFYLGQYWKWLRYLWWKWKAVPYYEQQSRIKKGLCWNCGYDIRASPERRPECGAVVIKPEKNQTSRDKA